MLTEKVFMTLLYAAKRMAVCFGRWNYESSLSFVTHLVAPLPSGSVFCHMICGISAKPTRQHQRQGKHRQQEEGGAGKRHASGTKSRRDGSGGGSGRGGGRRRDRGLALDTTTTNSPMTRRQQQQQQQHDSFPMEEESQIVTYGEQYNPATGWTW